MYLVSGAQLQFVWQRVPIRLWHAELPHVLFQLPAQTKCWKWGRRQSGSQTGTPGTAWTSCTLLGTTTTNTSQDCRSRKLWQRSWKNATCLQCLVSHSRTFSQGYHLKKSNPIILFYEYKLVATVHFLNNNLLILYYKWQPKTYPYFYHPCVPHPRPILSHAEGLMQPNLNINLANLIISSFTCYRRLCNRWLAYFNKAF